MHHATCHMHTSEVRAQINHKHSSLTSMPMVPGALTCMRAFDFLPTEVCDEFGAIFDEVANLSQFDIPGYNKLFRLKSYNAAARATTSVESSELSLLSAKVCAWLCS